METDRDIWRSVIGVILGSLAGVFLLFIWFGGGWILMAAVLALLPIALVLQGFLGKRAEGLAEDGPTSSVTTVPEDEDIPTPRSQKFSRTVIAGFIASVAMLVTFAIAYGMSLLLAGDIAKGADTASRVVMGHWFYNLTHNHVLDLAQNLLYLSVAAHFAAGLALAMLYAYVFEPRLPGPGWVRGTIFSVIPWAFSVAVFFPVIGGGFLGVALGAGPLPFLGNLVLHLVYGITLGLMCEPAIDRLGATMLDPDLASRTEENYQAMLLSQRMTARGVIMGLIIGAAVGTVLSLGTGPSMLAMPPALTALSLILLGGAFGALIGSFFGLPAHGRATGGR